MIDRPKVITMKPRTLILILLLVVGFGSVLWGKCGAHAASKVVCPLHRPDEPRHPCDELVKVVCEREAVSVCDCLLHQYHNRPKDVVRNKGFCRLALTNQKVYESWMYTFKFFMDKDCP